MLLPWLLLDEHSPRIPAAKRRLMVWPLQPRSSTEAFCLKSSHVHICSTPVFKRALSSSEHVRWTLTPLRACPALPSSTRFIKTPPLVVVLVACNAL